MYRYNVLLRVARSSFGVGKIKAKDENDAKAQATCMATVAVTRNRFHWDETEEEVTVLHVEKAD